MLIAYNWEDFFKPKICWNRISSIKVFSIAKEGIFIQDSMHFIVGDNLYYLLALLNSKLLQWQLSKIIGESAGGNAGNADNILNLPIPKQKNNKLEYLAKSIEKNEDKEIQNIINQIVYQLYNLSQEEIDYIEK